MSIAPSDNSTIREPVLDQERQRTAREYSRIRRRLGFGETGLTLAILLILVFTGISHWFTGLFNWPVTVVAIIYFLAFTVGYSLITSPLSYYRGFILPHRYGISKQKIGSWLADRGKSAIISLVLGAAAITVVYTLLQNFPDFWWLIAWGLMLVFSVIMSILAPVILVPLFFKMKPLADSDLKSRLEQLSQKARTRVQGIYVLDFSSKVTSANAALMGMGRTRRIVISDTLIQNYTTPEIEVITAHEIGHHVDRDIFRLFIVQSAVFLVIIKVVEVIFRFTVDPLGFSGIADPAALPWLMLLFGAVSSLTSPLMNGYTRHVESQADDYALGLTDDPKSFGDAMTRLANQNLAVAHPPAWEEYLFYDHPSIHKRLEHARKYASNSKPDPGN